MLSPTAGRTIEGGRAYINNRERKPYDLKLSLEDLASETVMVVRSGRRKYGLLRFV